MISNFNYYRGNGYENISELISETAPHAIFEHNHTSVQDVERGVKTFIVIYPMTAYKLRKAGIPVTKHGAWKVIYYNRQLIPTDIYYISKEHDLFKYFSKQIYSEPTNISIIYKKEQ